MKKLIIFFMFIMTLNIFSEEKIEFHYFYYTNKLYHSTLKTEIIPKDCIFINEYSNNNTYKYIYDFNKKEKKLFYKHIEDEDKYYYYDFNNNMYEDFADENIDINSMYKVTKNRFGESLYDIVINNYYNGNFSSYLNQQIYFYRSDTYNTNYINKAYKYSLTQDEIINKNSIGIYLLKTKNIYDNEEITTILCFQNEYYDRSYSDEEVKNYKEYISLFFKENKKEDFAEHEEILKRYLDITRKSISSRGIERKFDSCSIVFKYDKQDVHLNHLLNSITASDYSKSPYLYTLQHFGNRLNLYILRQYVHNIQ